MKRILLSCSFIILMASCINDQESLQNIHNRDLQAIADYMRDNSLQGVRSEQDGATGVVIIWTKENINGRSPEVGDYVKLNYTGSFFDARVFDTSLDSVARANNIHHPSREYKPMQMIIGDENYIRGFILGVNSMKEGDKAIILIPSRYAYGTSGHRGSIPPNTPLRFDLEMIEIKSEAEIEI
ncbi:FKBP-type peptidyl-prolyl cis-trans isomerase [Anditalea andensis]|uniref:Peptidyl-prolyl cis-trans isomerase n=1 Tax=Anditalea andensis TaxID=1048983 RepID=A0A074KTS7_9BACT|nr:FKBP-type peptidyl-prolyl cis-trans isomerase [Anditalea andensis]KEO73381.1 hypothetical protein EL17_13645 [Anditalea andensis]